MTKADLITKISRNTQVEESTVLPIIESLLATVKESLAQKGNVYLREFGSFMIQYRKQKIGRNISQSTNVIISAHNAPVFKPSETFKGQNK